MAYLLDTNIVSEARKPRGDARVKAWVRAAPSSEQFLSVLVLGEIRKGIERLMPSDPVQAATLDRWLAQLVTRFSGRLLGVDARVADVWGRVSAMRTAPTGDSLMAATAVVHGLVVVTSNVNHFEGLGVQILDPTA